MNMIVRPLTDDRSVGYDEFGQLTYTLVEGDRKTSWHIADVRHMTCPICNRGWEATGPAMADQTRWDLVDGYAHETCLVRHIGLIERAEFSAAVCGARIRHRKFITLPNGYWGSDVWGQKPWYSAELLDYPIVIILGYRKRVASIEVKPQGGTELAWYRAAEAAFADEQVTKEFSAHGVLLHAWGFDNVRRYMKMLAAVGSLATPPSV